MIMKNPIFDELKKLKLVSRNDSIVLNNKTRDKKIKVIKDLKTKIIYLEEYITSNEYYSSLKYKDGDKKAIKKNKKKIENIKKFFWKFKNSDN